MQRNTWIALLIFLTALLTLAVSSLKPERTPPVETGQKEHASSSDLTTPLGPISPSQIKNSAIAAFVDKSAPMSRRLPADFAGHVTITNDPADVAGLRFVLRDVTDDDGIRNEAANVLRRSNEPHLEDDLLRCLHQPEEGPRFRSFCVQHLGLLLESTARAERTSLYQQLEPFMEDRDRSVRREAFLALVRCDDPKALSVVDNGLGVDAWQDFYDLIIRSYVEKRIQGRSAMVRPYAYSNDPAVRIAAIFALSSWGDEESIPAFQEATNSKNAQVREAGRAALNRCAVSAPPKG